MINHSKVTKKKRFINGVDLCLVMENPLSLEERVNVSRLIDHDLASHQVDIYHSAIGNRTLTPDVLYAKENHVKNVLAAITILTTYTQRRFRKARNVEFSSPLIPRLFQDGTNVEWLSEFRNGDLVTSYPVLHTALYNLIKNGFDAMGGKGTVAVRVEPYIGYLPDKLVFTPSELSNNRLFIKFEIHDTGKGFPADKPLEDSLNLGVSGNKRGGFGLYYVKLACKFLKAPLAITPESGNTNVTIYHPTNLS